MYTTKVLSLSAAIVFASLAASCWTSSAFAGNVEANLTSAPTAVQGVSTSIQFLLDYTPDPGDFALTGVIRATFDDEQGNETPFFQIFNAALPYTTSFDVTYVQPGLYQPSILGTIEVTEENPISGLIQNDVGFSASALINVLPTNPGGGSPSMPAGAPAPLAGAGFLSFLGIGGVAARKRAGRIIAGLFVIRTIDALSLRRAAG